MHMWTLTPYIGDDVQQQRTISPWGLVELPRRQVFIGIVASMVWGLFIVAPMSFLYPFNWGLGMAGVAATIWVFTARTKGLGIRQYQRMLDLAKAKVGAPLYAGGAARTRVDEVRYLQQSWMFAPLDNTDEVDVMTRDVFGNDLSEAVLAAPEPIDLDALPELDVTEFLER